MKEYKETCKWLKSKNFCDKDIHYIKELYEKESIKFCIKTFLSGDLKSLRKYLDDIYEKENEKFYKDLFKSVEGVDVELAMNMLVT